MGQLVWFLILTLIYTYLDYGLKTSKDADKNAGTALTYKSIYLLMSVLGQYFITVGVSADLCGTPQYYSALFATAFPWVFIFGSMIGMLAAFPGWVMPFSNTIGYWIASSAGMGKLANEVFQEKSTDKDLTYEMRKALSYIYTDKATLINNVTPNNFDQFWDNSSQLRTGLPEDMDADEAKKRFKNFVMMKHIIGTTTWYLLTGALVISVSYNYIINSACATSLGQITQEADEAQEEEAAREDPAAITYFSTE